MTSSSVNTQLFSTTVYTCVARYEEAEQLPPRLPQANQNPSTFQYKPFIVYTRWCFVLASGCTYSNFYVWLFSLALSPHKSMNAILIFISQRIHSETILTVFTRMYIQQSPVMIVNDCPHSSKYSLAAHFMNLCYATFFWFASGCFQYCCCLLLLLWCFPLFIRCCHSISFHFASHISIFCWNRRALSALSKMP